MKQNPGLRISVEMAFVQYNSGYRISITLESLDTGSSWF